MKNLQIQEFFRSSPVILFLLSDVDSQRLRIIVKHDASVQTHRLLKLLNRLEFHVAESLELISLLVLHQTNILHRQLAEDLNHVALYDTLREVPDECQEGWLGWQRLLALMIVVPEKTEADWNENNGWLVDAKCERVRTKMKTKKTKIEAWKMPVMEKIKIFLK